MEENDENYFSLIDVYTCTKDIIVSVCDFAVSTRQFFIDLWVEFYLQLTTISWLSVRNAESHDDHKILGLLESLQKIGSMFSFPSYEEDKVAILTDGVLLTKSEETVRLSNEMIANNTKARASLAMTEMIRWENMFLITLKIIPLFDYRKSALENITVKKQPEF